MKRAVKYLPLAFESLLLVLALVWVLVQAVKLQNTAGDGLVRWQQDVVTAKSIDMPESPRRIWCRRDNAWLAGTVHDPLLDACPGRVWLRVIGWLTPSATRQLPIEISVRWQQELVEHASRWRTLLAQSNVTTNGMDASPGADPGVFAPADTRDFRERQRITESLATWDAWQIQHFPQGTGQIQVMKLDDLWRMAMTLDGIGNEEPAKLIRQYRKRMEQSDKASRSLSLVNDLPLWLMAHWLVTVLGMSIVRSPLQRLDQWQGLILLCMGSLFLLHQARLMPLPLSLSVLMAVGMLLLGVIWLLKLFAKPVTPPVALKWVSLPVLLPGWWLFTATGWLLLLDESLNFHPRLRFLALDQWWNWGMASVIFILAVVLSPLTLSWLNALTRWLWGRAGMAAQAWRWLLALLVLMSFAVAHRSGVPAHVTGEAMKLVFVFAAAGWCVWKMPLASQLWHESQVRRSMLLMSGMLALIVLTAVMAGLTSDKGPWLVIAIVAVMLMASVMGWTTGFALLLTGFLCIFLLGEQLDVVADRLQAWRNAFTANHDDMARLLWFQYEASLQDHGWGIGQTPWCAGVRPDQCPGLPLQLQSDYTFTALVGWWGPKGAWVCVVIFSLYVYVWLMHAAKQSHALLLPEKLIQPIVLSQALSLQIFFVTGLLVLVQTWITVCGNLGWLPLTGITWPLISYGKTSLWLTTFLMGTWGWRKSYA